MSFDTKGIISLSSINLYKNEIGTIILNFTGIAKEVNLDDVLMVMLSKSKYKAIFLILKNDRFVYTVLADNAIQLLQSEFGGETVIPIFITLENLKKVDNALLKGVSFFLVD